MHRAPTMVQSSNYGTYSSTTPNDKRCEPCASCQEPCTKTIKSNVEKGDIGIIDKILIKGKVRDKRILLFF